MKFLVTEVQFIFEDSVSVDQRKTIYDNAMIDNIWTVSSEDQLIPTITSSVGYGITHIDYHEIA